MTRLNYVHGFMLMLILFMPLGAGAEEVMRMTLEDALEIAEKNNYALKAAKARVDQAEARYLQSRKAYLPKVTISETFVATDDPAAVFSYKLRQGSIAASDFDPALLNDPDAASNFQTGIEVQQPLFNRDAMIGRAAASADRKSQEYMLDRTSDAISLEVKRAYYGLILAKKNLLAVNRSITAMKAHDNEARKAYQKGLITKSDKLSTAVRLSELAERKMIIQDEITAAEDGLRFLLGLSSNEVIEPVDGLNAAAVVIPDEEPELRVERADLKALEARLEAAGYQYEKARAQWLPRVNAFMQQNWNDDDFAGLVHHNWTLGVNLQWAVFDGYASIGKAREAKAGEREVRYAYEEAKEKGLYEIRKAYRMLRTAKARIRVAEQSLREAKVSLDFIGERYRSGLAMTFELLGREQAYTYAQLRLNKAKYDLIITKSELDYYIGG